MVNYPKNKRGIAMIELIFALVIMGIVLMSAPMLIQQSVKSSNVALQQEAISAVASQISIIQSMHWDENNTDLGDSKILNTNSLNFPPAGLMQGANPLADVRSFNNAKFPTQNINFGNKDTNESTYTDFDDVDDYNGSNFGLILFNNENTTSDKGEYVDIDINISTIVEYHDDNVTLNNSQLNIPSGLISTSKINTTNIKFITSTLTSNSGVKELEKNITMKAFSCNIGTYDIIGELK